MADSSLAARAGDTTTFTVAAIGIAMTAPDQAAASPCPAALWSGGMVAMNQASCAARARWPSTSSASVSACDSSSTWENTAWTSRLTRSASAHAA
jgi:hypothetical protein